MGLIFPHELHIKVWKYIADNPGMYVPGAVLKMHSFGLLTNNEAALFFVRGNDRLGCLYGRIARRPGYECCTECPFVTMAQHPAGCLDQVFCNWVTYTYPVSCNTYYSGGDPADCATMSAMYARIIADWPVRKKVICGSAEDFINMNTAVKRDVKRICADRFNNSRPGALSAVC